MSDPVYAADGIYAYDLLGHIAGDIDPIDTWRRACGWDGEGDPPTIVILPDGRLAVTSFGIEPVRLIVPVTEDGPDDRIDTDAVRKRHVRFVDQRTDRCDYDELLWPCDAVRLADEVDRLRAKFEGGDASRSTLGTSPPSLTEDGPDE